MLAGLLLAAVLLPMPPGIAAAGPAAAAAAIGCPIVATPLCLKLTVAEDGLVRITPEDVQRAGWNLADVNPRTFSLASQGQPVAIRVPGEADGRFDGADYLEFYGQRFHGEQMEEKYTDDNVYWLAAGGTAGPRMASSNAAPQGAPAAPPSFWTIHHAEENYYWYTHNTLGWPTQNTWWWANTYVTTSTAPNDPVLPTVLPAPASEVYTATLEIELASRRTEGGHHFQVFWHDTAGQPVLDDVFYGHQVYRATADLPGNTLLPGENKVIVRVLNDQAVTAQSGRSAANPMRQQLLDDFLNPVDTALYTDDGKAYAFDWVYTNYYTLHYRRLYQAVDDQIEFSADQPGARTFTLRGFSSADVWLYDVSDPMQPVRLTGAQISPAGDGTYTVALQAAPDTASRYLALTGFQALQPKQIARPLPSTVRSSANGADWIVISHADFLPQAQRLANYRASHDGFRTAVVDVAELYEQFNDGIFHPDAIRRFVAYAVDNWQPPAPRFVVLLGDGNWNFKAYGAATYGTPDPNWIPPYLVWEDPWQGEVGSDNAFVNLNDDPLPELAIGRLPARTLVEAATMVDKIISYEAQANSYPLWRQRALFVADNSDSTGNYPGVADYVIATALPANVEPARAYLGITFPATQASRITDLIVEEINGGVSMVTYMGHGSVNRWADEQIWRTDYTSRLTNVDRLPLVITLNCLDGYFIHGNAALQSVAEEMVRHPGGGAVATWSPSGLGTTSIETILNRALFNAFFVEGERRLGPATMEAKAVLYDLVGDSSPFNTTLIHTMTVFGDPALQLNLPAWRLYLPLAQQANAKR